jgi:hypothetical protein
MIVSSFDKNFFGAFGLASWPPLAAHFEPAGDAISIGAVAVAMGESGAVAGRVSSDPWWLQRHRKELECWCWSFFIFFGLGMASGENVSGV